MSSYRIYYLNERGGLGLPEELSATSDQQALEEAHLKKFWKCEIWDGRRLVASLGGHRFAG